MRINLELQTAKVSFGRDVDANVAFEGVLKSEFYIENALGHWELVLGSILTFDSSLNLTIKKEVVWPKIVRLEISKIEFTVDNVGVTDRKDGLYSDVESNLKNLKFLVNEIFLKYGLPFPYNMLQLYVDLKF